MDDLEIEDGEKLRANLKDEELEGLVGAWMEYLHPEVEGTVMETSESVKMALARKEDSDFLVSHLKEAVLRGDMVVARMGGEVAGMVRAFHVTTSHVNDVDWPILEIGKALVMPKFRKQGIYRKINAKLISNLREKYGDVILLAGTKQEHVKTMHRAEGWVEIDFAVYQKLHGYPEEEIAAQYESRMKDGWTAFLYIPKALSDQYSN